MRFILLFLEYKKILKIYKILPEKADIKEIIYDNLSLKNKNNEYIDINGFFVTDKDKIIIKKNRIVRNNVKKTKKKGKSYVKFQ